MHPSDDLKVKEKYVFCSSLEDISSSELWASDDEVCVSALEEETASLDASMLELGLVVSCEETMDEEAASLDASMLELGFVVSCEETMDEEAEEETDELDCLMLLLQEGKSKMALARAARERTDFLFFMVLPPLIFYICPYRQSGMGIIHVFAAGGVVD